MNIGKIPAKTARLDPSREAVIDVHSERRVTYGELDERICRLANGLTGELGLSKGELALAQAVVYLACAAKSNAVYTAFGAAMRDARDKGSLEVPMHLRNAPTGLMKNLGYGDGYRYAHDEDDAVALGETYFPEDMPPVKYYHPVARGLEIRIREKLEDIERRAREKK